MTKERTGMTETELVINADKELVMEASRIPTEGQAALFKHCILLDFSSARLMRPSVCTLITPR